MHDTYQLVSSMQPSTITDDEDKRLLVNGSANSQNDALSQWVENLSEETFNTQDGLFNRSNVVRMLVIILGFFGPTAYISSAKKFANGDYTLEVLYAISEVLGGGMLTAYIFLEVVRHIETIRSDKRQSNTCEKFLLLALPIIIGLLTSIPATIVGLLYNENDKALALSAFMGDFIANTYSIQRLARHKYYSRKLTTAEKQQVKQWSIKLNQAMHAIIQMPTSGITNFINQNQLVNNHQINVSVLSDILKNNFDVESKAHLNRRLSCCASVAKWATCLALPLPWLIVNIYLTYTHLDSYLNSKSAAGIFTCLSTSFVYMLDVIFLKDIIDLCNSCLKNKGISNFYFNKYPLRFMCAQLLMIAASSLSFASRAQVIKDEVSENYSSLIIPFSSTVTLLMRFFSIGNIVNDLFKQLTMRLASISVRNHIKCIHIVKAVLNHLKACSTNDINSLSTIIGELTETKASGNKSSLFPINTTHTGNDFSHACGCIIL